MKKFLIIIFLCTSTVFSQSITIIGEGPFLPGDSLNILIESEENISLETLNKSLESNKSKMGPFHIVRVGFLKKENEKTLIGLNVIYEKPVMGTTIPFVLYPKRSVFFTNLDSEKLKKEKTQLDQDFFIFDRETEIESKSIIKIVLAGLLIAIVVLVLLYWVKRKYEVRKNIKKEQELIARWRDFFKRAHSRKDYERIYKERKNWIKKVDNNLASNFLAVIEEHQYKKEWDQAAMYQVTKSFDPLRDNIK